MIKILDLIYPPKCGFCGKICAESLCTKCFLEIKKYENKIEYFNTNRKYFDEYENIFKYDGKIRDKIIEYKFQNKAYLYKTFTKIILNNKKICGFLEKYDIIIPIPIHKNRKKERGYNQTELIAREIAKNTKLILEKDVLVKIKNVTSQTKLTKEKRIQNVKDVFKIISNKKIYKKNIILLDDIYTTGSTVNEASRILKLAGARKIGVLTIAKD